MVHRVMKCVICIMLWSSSFTVSANDLQSDCLAWLPNEMVDYIAQYLGPKDVVNLAKVDRQLYGALKPLLAKEYKKYVRRRRVHELLTHFSGLIYRYHITKAFTYHDFTTCGNRMKAIFDNFCSKDLLLRKVFYQELFLFAMTTLNRGRNFTVLWDRGFYPVAVDVGFDISRDLISFFYAPSRYGISHRMHRWLRGEVTFELRPIDVHMHDCLWTKTILSQQLMPESEFVYVIRLLSWQTFVYNYLLTRDIYLWGLKDALNVWNMMQALHYVCVLRLRLEIDNPMRIKNYMKKFNVFLSELKNTIEQTPREGIVENHVFEGALVRLKALTDEFFDDLSYEKTVSL